jgi:hypothetical protein
MQPATDTTNGPAPPAGPRSGDVAVAVEEPGQGGDVAPDVEAPYLAQVLAALGTAFLVQRALVDDVNADTFTRGLRGLVAGQAVVRS